VINDDIYIRKGEIFMIQSIYNDTTSVDKTQQTQSVQEVQKTQEEEATKTASEEAASSTAAVYEKTNSTIYTVSDTDKLNLMLEESNLKASNFQKLMESIINKQATTVYQAFPTDITSFSGSLKDYISGLQVDDATRTQAQQDIADDGYYGVEQTTNRIMDFAKAIAGDDPDKIAEMRTAVEKGFANAEKIWGDTLPDISQKTYDNVMASFDQWQSEVSQTQESVVTDESSAQSSAVASITSKK
jgi:hypothetical protein